MIQKVFFIVLILTTLIYSNVSNFLNDQVSVSVLSMGGVNTLFIQEASSISGNPALLSQLIQNQIQISGIKNYNLDYLRGSIYFSKTIYRWGSIGFGYKLGYIDKIPETRLNTSTSRPEIIRMFTDKKHLFYIGWGTRILDKLHAGLNIKFLYENLFNKQAYYFNSDIGLIYDINKYLHLSMVLKEYLYPHVMWSPALKNESIPRAVKVGIGSSLYENRFLTVAEISINTENEYSIFGGISYKFNDIFTIKLGLDNKNICAGLQLTYKNYILDYGFKINELCYRHLVGIKYNFGDPYSLEKKLLDEIQIGAEKNIRTINYLDKLSIIKEKINNIFKEDIDIYNMYKSNIDIADDYLMDGKVTAAKTEYNKVPVSPEKSKQLKRLFKKIDELKNE